MNLDPAQRRPSPIPYTKEASSEFTPAPLHQIVDQPLQILVRVEFHGQSQRQQSFPTIPRGSRGRIFPRRVVFERNIRRQRRPRSPWWSGGARNIGCPATHPTQRRLGQEVDGGGRRGSEALQGGGDDRRRPEDKAVWEEEEEVSADRGRVRQDKADAGDWQASEVMIGCCVVFVYSCL